MATKTPTGLALARDDYKFTFTWTPRSKSKAQKVTSVVEKRNPSPDKKDIDGIKKGTKSTSDTLSTLEAERNTNGNTAKYKPLGPNSLTKVTFKVKGKKGSWSAWKKVSYAIHAPSIPEYVAPQPTNQNYTYSYNWEYNKYEKDDHVIFVDYEWQTILLYGNNVGSGKDLSSDDWTKSSTQKISLIDPVSGDTLTNQNSYGHGTYTSISIIDNPDVITKSGRRFFRVRARGPAGESKDWQYSDHSFAAPSKPTIDASSAVINDSDGNGTAVSFPINSESTHLNPVTENTFMYAIVNPRTVTTSDGDWVRSSVTLPLNFNSWTEGTKFGSTGTESSYSFHTNDVVGADEALFVKIDAANSGATSSSDAILVKTQKDKPLILSNPSLMAVVPHVETNSVTITIKNNATSLQNNKSFIAVYFRSDKNQQAGKPIGIIPYVSDAEQTATFVMPEYSEDATPSIGIACYVADYTPASAASSYPGIYTEFTIENESMVSDVIWEENAVPKPPAVNLSKLREGTIQASWEWTWDAADTAELSWSDDPNAWESTNEPSTYTITRPAFGGKWNITGLGAGIWYVRVRLIHNSDQGIFYGTYSKIEQLSLSSAPNTPSLYLTPKVCTADDTITATWRYSSTDGSDQSYAQLYKAERADESSPWTYTELVGARTEKGTSIQFKPSTYNWAEGSEHYVCVRVQSESGFLSEDYSNPLSNKISIASLPVITVTGLTGQNGAMEYVDIPIGESGQETRTDLSLRRLPLSFTVTGAGPGGVTTAVITRAEGFNLERPDDSTMTGFKGETIIEETIRNGNDSEVEFEFTADDFRKSPGHLDDEAQYNLTITVTDTYGQTVSTTIQEIFEQNSDIFYVHWEHQAVMPDAIVRYDTQEKIGLITVPYPDSGYQAGDYFEIYRLSADRPQLIYTDGVFGSNKTYVDPYPTYGIFSGYRIVYVTRFGDYRLDTTGELTWKDYGPMVEDVENRIDYLSEFAIRLDFEDQSLELPGNVSLSNTWNKDFQLTRYLGGSMEGDWNPGVERTGSYKATIPIENNPELMYQIRRLADYAGVVHVRTPDGSNFYANVNISDDRESKWVTRLSQITLNITKVDTEVLDGMTLEEWEAEDND